MTPQRVQMSRQHPWRDEHPDAVIVARPSKWGNPFKIGGEYVVDDGVGLGVLDVDSAIVAASAFHLWLTGEFDVREFAEQKALILAQVDRLRGRDLACWCPLGNDPNGYFRCHADALLELANAEFVPCGRGICAAHEGHEGTCAQASGWVL